MSLASFSTLELQQELYRRVSPNFPPPLSASAPAGSEETARVEALALLKDDSVTDYGEIDAALTAGGVADAELRQVLAQRLSGSAPPAAPAGDEPLVEVRKLRAVPLLVLDNSLRESTVAALRGHTIDDKWRILEHVEKCGFEHIMLGALSSTSYRVDDLFAEQVRDSADFASRHEGRFFAFTEVTDGATPEGAWLPGTPVALQKMQRYKIYNPIVEVDLDGPGLDYTKFDAVAMTTEVLQWAAANLGTAAKPPRICMNMRDFFGAMETNPKRVETFIRAMSALPKGIRPWAMLTEDPSGSYLPQTIAGFMKKYRAWWGPVSSEGVQGGGNLGIHVHKGFGLAEAAVLASLGAGANAIWCSVAETGAALGHANSALTVTNMARYGNPVAQALPGGALREAAIEVTRITTGEDPPATTEIYGERANQWVFDFAGMGDSFIGTRWHFNQAAFVSVKKEARIHTLSSTTQFRDRLVSTIGDYDYDDEVLAKMRDIMLADLRSNVKLQYQSPLAVAALYQRAGGKLPDAALKKAEESALRMRDPDPVIEGVKKQWDEVVADPGLRGSINFRDFYDTFLARHLGCYSCHAASVAWRFFDVNNDGKLEWIEFAAWLHWCQLEFQKETPTAEKLLDTLFCRIVMADVRRGLDLINERLE